MTNINFWTVKRKNARKKILFKIKKQALKEKLFSKIWFYHYLSYKCPANYNS